MTNRRNFIKKTAAGAIGITVGGVTLGMSAKNYSRIIGANDRLNVALIGCGRRVNAYYNMIIDKKNNIDLGYICDVMKSQREKVARELQGKVTGNAILTNDIREVMDNHEIDAVFNATPDHWHAPGACMAMEAGKHVYLEKPCSHNPHEGELLVAFQKKYGKVVQMGTQQRSSPESIEIISEIHNGIIGEVYSATTYFSGKRGMVPIPKKAQVLAGLDWELFQGPAPRVEYMDNIWDYNWHWYGWNWGTAEAGNNGTHELDVARWALQVEYPEYVSVEAYKRHFLDDGWEMYDTMEAMFRFPGDKIIKWDGKSRNGYKSYCRERGTIIYGTEGSVSVDREGYQVFDRVGKLIREKYTAGSEAGNVLGGGGDITDLHIINFFDNIRGKSDKLNSPIDMSAISQMLVHYANISYRIGKSLTINTGNGHIFDREAMKFWGREYEPGWEPKL